MSSTSASASPSSSSSTTSITARIEQLNALRGQMAQLEMEIAEKRRKDLAALPAQFGFESVADFLDAVSEATGTRGAAKKRGRPAGGGTKSAASGKIASNVQKPRKRAVITDETRTKLKALVKAGKTGSEIAKALGISIATVQNLKRDLGLVAKR